MTANNVFQIMKEGFIKARQMISPPEFIHGDCSQCGDEEVLLIKSEQEDEPLHYVCKECFLRGY